MDTATGYNKKNPRTKLPFQVDRASRRNLSEQVADGLREAIATGYFRSGDILPNLDDMAKQLGVSMRIPREAIECLKKEGIVNPRPCIGCQVMAKRETLWRGKVLFICTDDDEVSYYTGMVIGELRKRLAEKGYLLSCVSGMVKASGKTDYALLGPALLMHADFAIVLGYYPTVFRMLSRSGIPFAVIGNTPMKAMQNLVGTIPYDNEPAFRELVACCINAGVKTVEQVDFEMSRTVDASRLCKEAGIKLKRVIIPPKRGIGWLEGIVRAASEYFHARIGNGTPLPDLLFFAEDFVAFGALPALEASKIGIPEELKIVTCAQRGYEPVFPMSLARILTDPREHGAALANYAINYLESGTQPVDIALRPAFVAGATLPC